MRNTIFFLLLFILSISAWSQDHFNYFKTIPPIDETVPEWAKLMYTSRPNVYQVETLYQSYYREHEFQKSTHTQNFKNWKKNLERLNYIGSDGFIDIPNYHERQSIKEKRKEAWLTANILKSAVSWTPKGPFETRSGDGTQWNSEQVNIYTIDQSISNPDILYSAILLIQQELTS